MTYFLIDTLFLVSNYCIICWVKFLFDSKISIYNESKKYRSLLASTSQSTLLIHICEVEINSQIKRKISFGIQIFYWICCLLFPLYLYLLYFFVFLLTDCSSAYHLARRRKTHVTIQDLNSLENANVLKIKRKINWKKGKTTNKQKPFHDFYS